MTQSNQLGALTDASSASLLLPLIQTSDAFEFGVEAAAGDQVVPRAPTAGGAAPTAAVNAVVNAVIDAVIDTVVAVIDIVVGPVVGAVIHQTYYNNSSVFYFFLKKFEWNCNKLLS